ncbi:Interleukin-1 receptor accessory protein [Dissostichus eleginoides]|uniref:Interleukin-1 receptor accessory protein n=1 Tax=Dissostichus eleginoides TaxID=100907 RepID=A0AAD9CJE3_DISEL|nr:Interleukin-1 receptor accessory protein [Dissostichus eleginoides]KAK1900689.1 Interleukin-1 receptor accessory protein [Dissostichus eleginoides]
MQQSRRLLFVLSPAFLSEKSLSLLECRLGLFLQNERRASIVSVVFQSVSKHPSVEAAQLQQVYPHSGFKHLNILILGLNILILGLNI